MKSASIFIVTLFIRLNLEAQYNLDSIHPLFKGDIDGDLIRSQYVFSSNGSPIAHPGPSMPPVLIIGIFRSNKLLIRTQAPPEKLPEVKKWKNSDQGILTFKQREKHLPYPVPVFDSSGIIVTVNGINKQNVKDFQFRVVENKTKIVVPWSAITLFCKPYLFSARMDGTDETEVAYLGKFTSSFGNGLTFEIRKTDSLNAVSTLSAIWVNRKPEVLGIFSRSDMRSFLAAFKRQWQEDLFLRTTPKERAEKDSNLILKKNFKSNEKDLIFYLDDKIRSKEIIEYNLLTGKHQTGWKPNDFDLNLVWLKNLSPGEHKLLLRYSIQRHNITEYQFKIQPAWFQTLVFKISAILLCLFAIGFIYLLLRSRQEKMKLKLEKLQKQEIQAELKSIRSQFNPHFVFNALNSIQGLITKNDMEGANKYLTEFSMLLREALTESGRENINLKNELKLIETYIKLEQLRFGFTYSIQVDDSIDLNITEVPVLLSQPLIENAIKHGIASMYDKGELQVLVEKSGLDLNIIITDNGKGFDTTKEINGHGINLTEERISILNKTISEQKIEMTINTSATGTKSSLLFQNWFS